MQEGGLGGALHCALSCTGCVERNLEFDSTAEVEGSRRTQVALAVEVALELAGAGYAMSNRLFGQALGLHTISEANFASHTALASARRSDT